MGEKGSNPKNMDLGDVVGRGDHVNGELLKELRIDAGDGDEEDTDEISSSFKAGPREVYYFDQSLWKGVAWCIEELYVYINCIVFHVFTI